MGEMAERILCVDDDEQVRRLVTRVVSSAGYDCVAAASTHEARSLIAEGSFAVVLCDIELPGESGLDLLAELSHESPDVAIVMVTGHDAPSVADAALELGAYGYLTKPFAANDLRIDLANALHRRRLEMERRAYEEMLQATVEMRTVELRETVRKLAASELELRRAYKETVDRLGRTIDYHDFTTGAHVERVATYAARIAGEYGFGAERAELLRLASPLHDIGKIAVPDALLRKPASLTPDERLEIERHTEAGYELLTGSGNELLELAATIARSHHERWDGNGYPHRLTGDEIPLEGRIVAVADVFDALTSDRPYASRISAEEARALVASESGKAFDPLVVEAFLRGVA
jgi:putative two-component system response regulator